MNGCRNIILNGLTMVIATWALAHWKRFNPTCRMLKTPQFRRVRATVDVFGMKVENRGGLCYNGTHVLRLWDCGVMRLVELSGPLYLDLDPMHNRKEVSNYGS